MIHPDIGMPRPVRPGVGYLGLCDQHVSSRIVHLVPEVLCVAAPYEVHVAHGICIYGDHSVIRRTTVDNLYGVGQYDLAGLGFGEFHHRECAHHHQKNHCYAVSHLCSFHFIPSSNTAVSTLFVFLRYLTSTARRHKRAREHARRNVRFRPILKGRNHVRTHLSHRC